MKRYCEMDEAELVALTDEQINKLVDYECAMEGAPMLPPSPGPKPTNELPDKDATVYDVAGCLTLDKDHAAKILEAMTGGRLWSEGYEGRSYDVKFLQPISSSDYHYPKITTRTIYSIERWNEIKDRVSKHTATLQAWEAKDKEYTKAAKERCAIHDRVWNCVADAREHAEQREQLRREFARYLELAEGNRHIALNFLQKAKSLEEFPELVEEFCTNFPKGETDK